MMKGFLRYVLTLWLLLVATTCAWSQNVKADLLASSNYYQKQTNYSLNIEHSFFDSWTSTKPKESTTSIFRMNGDGYQYISDGVEVLQYNDMQVILDKGSKEVMVQNAVKHMFDPLDQADLDTLVKYCTRIERSVIDGAKIYWLYLPSGLPVSKLKMVLSEETKALMEIEMYLIDSRVGFENEPDNKSKVIVSYSGFKLTSTDISVDDMIKEVINVSEGEISLTKEYSSYMLINNIIKF